MKQLALVFLLITVLQLQPQVQACSTVTREAKERVLVGYNLDTGSFFPKVWFIPAAEGQYGRMCFGNGDLFGVAEGGMNEKGLFVAVNALNEETGWKADPALPDWETWEGWFGTGVPDGILAKCGTVPDAIAVFRAFNLFTFRNVKFLLADRQGNAVVIEWYDGGLRFLDRGSRNYLISTNSLTSTVADKPEICYRYKLACEMLEKDPLCVTEAFFRRVLSAIHLEFGTPTVYSNICDLKAGDITLYYFHNYEEPIRLNLGQALKQGRHGFELGKRFPIKPYVAQVYEDYYRQQTGK